MAEKALLVTAEVYSGKDRARSGWTAEERADELRELAVSCGAETVHEEVVKLKHVSPALFIGEGKAQEIAGLSARFAVDVVIFNNNLTGSQQKNLEDILAVMTVDRTQLILDIFARRAKSNEGKIQVELAQLTYLLPRLTGSGIILSRLGGGIGTRGPGEQKLEVNRRRIREKIARLKKNIDDITRQRETSRRQRTDFSLLDIAIIGYTNAGKSTLLNTLTGSRTLVRDRLFSTLDPTIRSYVLENNQKVIFCDTVGFLDDLPHTLIESFKATLEEVAQADLLIHVIDASHPKCRLQEKAVFAVLGEIGASEKPVVTVLNKIDRIEDAREVEKLAREFNDAVALSAVTGAGVDRLLDRIVLYLSKIMTVVSVRIPQHEMKAIGFIHEHAHIIKKEYIDQDVSFEVMIPTHLKGRLGKFMK
ncbi:MAG: GTPase HflX [Candidatus Omnitrophota bacterium]